MKKLILTLFIFNSFCVVKSFSEEAKTSPGPACTATKKYSDMKEYEGCTIVMAGETHVKDASEISIAACNRFCEVINQVKRSSKP